jgi:alginate O-acetyltransferase complex protein AlgI
LIFSSPLFLFAFLPTLLLAYAAVPAGWTNRVVLLASILFYSWGAPAFVGVVLGSALLDLAVVQRMTRSRTEKGRRAWTTLGVALNLAVLVYFKYTNFAVETVRHVAATWLDVRVPAVQAIALPIGVSFIVFEKITYIVDVHRGVGAPAKRVGDYLLYVFLFPKLLAGPIVKYHDIESQLARRERSFASASAGLLRFALGLAKKVLLADPMGELADAAFGPGGTVGFHLSWLGALAFSLQIFFDFSGYSDMAIGLARVFGFRLLENFDRPYLATGFGDFWRRWHISLSTWIRDYLYIPLGGARVSPARLYANLWICFLASGLWHGAAWTFVVWGAYHGLFLTLDRLFARRWLERLPRPAAVLLTFLAVTIGWVVFRAPSLEYAGSYLRVMFSPGAVANRFVLVTPDLYVVLLVGLAVCFGPLMAPWQRLRDRVSGTTYWPTASAAAAAGLFLLSLAKATTVAFHPFLYFRF